MSSQGFFNKLKIKESLNKGLNKISEQVDSISKLSTSNDIATPFEDETERRYYEIVYALLETMGPTGVRQIGISRYIKHFEGKTFDEEKYKKVLSFFNESTEYITGERNYSLYLLESSLVENYKQNGYDRHIAKKIIGINKELQGKTTYKCSKEEAVSICHNIKGATEDAKSKYINILNSVSSKGLVSFKNDVKEIIKSKRPSALHTSADYIERDALVEIIRKTTKEKFFNDDDNAKTVLFTFTLHTLWAFQHAHAVAAVALRAVHFEKYGASEKNYTSITADECKKIIATSDSIKNEFEIIDANIFSNGPNSNFWMPSINDSYYADKVCNFFCKELAQASGIDGVKDVNIVYNMIWERISLSDEERQRREEIAREKQREYEEYQAERAEEARRKEEARKEEARKEEARKEVETANLKATEDKLKATEALLRQEQEKRFKEEKLRKQQEEAKRREDANKKIYYYCFGPLDYDGVNVISHDNNVWAAKMAMLRTYGKTEADIKFYIAGERKDCSNYFDGRSFH